MILPFSAAVTIVSPLIGRLVGHVRRAPADPDRPLRARSRGSRCWSSAGTAIRSSCSRDWACAASAAALCLTPITTLAMTSVPRERAGMASGIMSAQRAIGSTVGFAVMGSVLAAWLSATLEPRPRARRARRAGAPRGRHGDRCQSANPRAHVAEVGPRQAIAHPDPGHARRDRGDRGSRLRAGHQARAVASRSRCWRWPSSPRFAGSRAAAGRC